MLNDFYSRQLKPIEIMKEEKNVLHGPPVRASALHHTTLGQLMLNQLRVHGTKVAQVNAYTGQEQTFEEILQQSQRLAAFLINEGLQSDNGVAVCSENNTEFCIPVCAAMFLGATVCPLNPMYTKHEMIHSLNISKPKFIFVSMIAVKTISELLKELPWSPKIILLTASNEIKLPSIKSVITNIKYDANFKAASVDVQNHVAVICCSSGTTGLPKGVMLTDKNILSVIRNLADTSAGVMDRDMTSLSLLPFFHVYAFTVLLVRLLFGNKNVILSRFDEKVFLRTIEKYKIEYLTLVPPLMVFLAKHPIVDKYNLSSVKEIWSGAAPLSQEISKAVAKRLNLPCIHQGYGLTETTLAVTSTPSGCTKIGSVGTLVPGVSAKVIPIGENESSDGLGPYSEGELCFKGDVIMKGYCNDEKSTAATIDKDGWFHSGDVGYYDNEGYFYVVDRLKELIKYKGFQVPPAELEAVLLTCPGIKDAAVVGLPNEEAGELPFAFVVKQDCSKLNAEDVIKYVEDRVSKQKRLRGGVKFVECIPKTASGKILRRVLRDSLKSKL